MRCHAIWCRYAVTLSIATSIAMSIVMAGLPAAPAGAAEQITLGTIGQASANIWPVLIALDQGFYTAEDLKVDIVYVQSSAALVQQVTAGSLPVGISAGLADPLRAVGMGAPISIMRIDVQAPPYDLVAKPSIASIADLKGKLISLGGPKDITRIYVERMLAPNGVKPGEFDMVFAGATAARASALAAGAVDAAILLPAFNFQAVAKGFKSLGLTVDYVKDLPFSGVAVNNAWAAANKPLLQKLLRVEDKSIAWFADAKNRTDAVRILKTASSLTEDDVEKAYDFFSNGNYFEPTGKVSRSKLDNLAKAMESLGDLPGALDIDKAVLPGITQMAD
ncbi:MAG TPA: ABC transporter substrate-binding protein [Xanthobacteraceae bacterium]|jgi:ABC-type nitrate/sulfonate/bicarbonate transport system substrate-binding protein|nr:ABC transporter substrate-binding protein [Xanthobacteraceae bacterium]